MQERSHLIVNGQTTTIHYDTLSQLPVLFSKPGITSYTAFTKVLLHTTNPNSHTGHPNGYMTKWQHQKLYLHELCAHEGFRNLNHWIWQGLTPGVDPGLSHKPDPVCAACAFGKAHRLRHNTHTGHIFLQHKKPGQGDSSDGMEASTPRRPFTTLRRCNYIQT